MDLIHKSKLFKLVKKNLGNVKLQKAIYKLVVDIENSNWQNKMEVINSRPDADRVHGESFFFFNINIHRTMILIAFNKQEAEVLWVGNHSEYDKTFKGSKSIIETWLRIHGKIK